MPFLPSGNHNLFMPFDTVDTYRNQELAPSLIIFRRTVVTNSGYNPAGSPESDSISIIMLRIYSQSSTIAAKRSFTSTGLPN